MVQPTMSSAYFDALAYFASGHIAYNDHLPIGLPSQDLIDLMLERKHIKKVKINPNDMVTHHDNPDRSFYFAISDEGQEAFYLEKEIREKILKQNPVQHSDHIPLGKKNKHLSYGDLIGIIGAVLTLISIILFFFQ